MTEPSKFQHYSRRFGSSVYFCKTKPSNNTLWWHGSMLDFEQNVAWSCNASKFFFYFVDRASRYNSLIMTNLKHFIYIYIYLFITPLYMFRTSQCSLSGDRIVLLHHLVWLVWVTAWYAAQLTGVPSSHLHRLIIPDDVLIQIDLLMMGTMMFETCREV